ncbi:hypothetical protein D9758_017588 [Tetrapyrgos nigripes]|uniref:Uncharacterized protein n=1 Tax=Tetrapyrgos nigripes TaxID=182062 RepID=A0A8H5C2G7_9AGAR|nr:hypothetical protein D9758_017588 [Tetrapyrgos nigripes]
MTSRSPPSPSAPNSVSNGRPRSCSSSSRFSSSQPGVVPTKPSSHAVLNSSGTVASHASSSPSPSLARQTSLPSIRSLHPYLPPPATPHQPAHGRQMGFPVSGLAEPDRDREPRLPRENHSTSSLSTPSVRDLQTLSRPVPVPSPLSTSPYTYTQLYPSPSHSPHRPHSSLIHPHHPFPSTHPPPHGPSLSEPYYTSHPTRLPHAIHVNPHLSSLQTMPTGSVGPAGPDHASINHKRRLSGSTTSAKGLSDVGEFVDVYRSSDIGTGIAGTGSDEDTERLEPGQPKRKRRRQALSCTGRSIIFVSYSEY